MTTSREFTASVRPHYGEAYNAGGVELQDEATGKAGFGYPGVGHWDNRLRWELSAKGVLALADRAGVKSRVLEGGGLIARVGRRVLELGCGRGVMTVALREVGLLAAGLDLTDDRTGPGPDIQGSALELPFADDTFDVVTAFDIVEHVPDDLQADLLGEIQRVTVHGGLVQVTVPAVGPFYRFDSTHEPVNHYLVLEAAAWASHFASHGFRIVSQGDELAMMGRPFNHGAMNYPLALEVS